MQHLESCLLSAKADRVLCQLVMFFLDVTTTGNGEPGARSGERKSGNE